MTPASERYTNHTPTTLCSILPNRVAFCFCCYCPSHLTERTDGVVLPVESYRIDERPRVSVRYMRTTMPRYSELQSTIPATGSQATTRGVRSIRRTLARNRSIHRTVRYRHRTRRFEAVLGSYAGRSVVLTVIGEPLQEGVDFGVGEQIGLADVARLVVDSRAVFDHQCHLKGFLDAVADRQHAVVL